MISGGEKNKAEFYIFILNGKIKVNWNTKQKLWYIPKFTLGSQNPQLMEAGVDRREPSLKSSYYAQCHKAWLNQDLKKVAFSLKWGQDAKKKSQRNINELENKTIIYKTIFNKKGRRLNMINVTFAGKLAEVR